MNEILHYIPREAHKNRKALVIFILSYSSFVSFCAAIMLIEGIVAQQTMNIPAGIGLLATSAFFILFGCYLNEHEYWIFEDRIVKKSGLKKKKEIRFDVTKINEVKILIGVGGHVNCNFYASGKKIVAVQVASLGVTQKKILKEFLYSHFKVRDPYYFFII